MECRLRPFAVGIWMVGLSLGLGLASPHAHAEARQVGGNKATWDRACKADKNCMPVGDLGDGINGYFVHDGNGGGTAVYCDDNNCAAERTMKPAKDAVQILQQPAGEIGGVIGSKAVTGKESPATLLNMH